MVVAVLGEQMVVDGAVVGTMAACDLAGRGVGVGPGGFRSVVLRGQPDLHVASAAMCPGIVGDEVEGDVTARDVHLVVVAERFGVHAEAHDGVGLLLHLVALVGWGGLDGDGALLGLTAGVGADDGGEDVEVVVGPLGAIDQRAALDGSLAAVGLYVLIGRD